MNRRSLRAASVAAVALLIAGYSAYWWIMADRLAAGIAAWANAQQQNGVAIDFEPHAIGGFPLRFSTTFGRPHVSGVIAGRKVDWRGPDVEASLWPFDLRTLHLRGQGRHQLSIESATTAIDADDLAVEVHFAATGRPTDISVESAAATVTLADSRAISLQGAKAALAFPSTPPETDQDVALQLSMTAKTLSLPQGIQLLTTDPIEDVSLDAHIKGPIPAAPLRQALAAWRDRGGIVEITSFAAMQATASVSGAATVALDADLQPIVAANLKAKGMGPTIDLLAGQKRIAPNDVLKLKLFVAATEQNGQVSSGLTIQNGALFLGPFKVARMAPIAWP